MYGFQIASDKPLPGVSPLKKIQAADITLTLAGSEEGQLPLFHAADWKLSPQQNAPSGVSLWRSKQAQGTYSKLHYFDGRHSFEFILSPNGDHIWALYPEQVQLHTITALLLGPVLGAVLRLRDISCLHASVVAVGASAVAFAGPSGAGKSTLAATLSEQSFSIIADDIAALEERESNDEFWVQPGYPRLRLQPGVINRLQETGIDLAPVSAYTDKRYLDLSPDHYGARSFQAQPLPLGAIYILDQRQAKQVNPSLIPLPAKEAVLSLVANTYGNYMVQPELRAREFHRLSRLAAQVPVQRLQRPDDLEALNQVYSLLADDFRKRLL